MLDLPFTVQKLREIAEGLAHPRVNFKEEADLLRGLADVLENLDGKQITKENLLEAADKAVSEPHDFHCIYCHGVTTVKDSLCSQCRYEIGS